MPGSAADGVAPSRRPTLYPVRLWSWGGPANQRALDAIAADFNAASTDLGLSVEHHLSSLDAGDFFGALLASVAGGNAPDLVHAQGWSWQRHAVQGFLQPLDEFASRDNWSAAWPREEAHDLQTRFRGKRYLATFSSTPYLMWIVPSRFLDAGVPLPRADWSYADFQDAAIRLTRRVRDRQQFGYLWTGGYRLNFPWWRMASQLEWDRVGDPRRAHWNTAAVIEAFQFQLYDSQYRLRISPTHAEFLADPDAFRIDRGAVAMAVRGPEMLARLPLAAPADTPRDRPKARPRLDVQLLPRGRASRTPHANLIEGLVMTRASKDKEAAWEALKWIAEDLGQTRVAEQGLLCNTPDAARRLWLPLAKRRYDLVNLEAFVRALEGASINLVGDIDEATLDRDAGLDHALTTIRDGAATAREALDWVQPRLQRILDSYWEGQNRAR